MQIRLELVDECQYMAIPGLLTKFKMAAQKRATQIQQDFQTNLIHLGVLQKT